LIQLVYCEAIRGGDGDFNGIRFGHLSSGFFALLSNGRAILDSLDLGYLERLTLQLTAGAAMLPDSVRDPHAAFVLSRQRTDGGWAGREGDSDLYYTGFALRSLAILGLLTGKVADSAGQFLFSRTTKPESIVDLLSLVYGAALIEASTESNPLQASLGDWKFNIGRLLTSLRRVDGGFARIDTATIGSTYQTFLVSICLELLGQPLPIDDPSVGFLLSQRRDDGGFLEVRVAKRAVVRVVGHASRSSRPQPPVIVMKRSVTSVSSSSGMSP